MSSYIVGLKLQTEKCILYCICCRVKMILGQNDFKLVWFALFFAFKRIMVINLEQKKIHFDLRFILIYSVYVKLPARKGRCEWGQIVRPLRHGDFQVFGSKRPKIRTTYLCRTQNTYGTLKERYQVNLQEKINHNQNFSAFSWDRSCKLEKGRTSYM